MKQTDQIRAILDEIDSTSVSQDDRTFAANFNFLELPELICSIVDYLQPSLYPYEGAIYWHIFRNAVLATGTQYTRVSVRGMMEGVITSSSGQSIGLSYSAVQKALQGLEDKGAISKAGDTNREGTLYKVHLPEEISSCQALMKQKQQIEPATIDTKRELDFYNVRENRLKVFERDGYMCHYCKKQLTRFSATLDHLQPVSKGGDNSFDNLATACLQCNAQRGNSPVMDILTKKESQPSDAPAS